jgi:carbonic anhydrase
MVELESLLKANEEYAKTFKHQNLKMPPAKKLAVLTCMDARLTVENFLGLNTGDAHIIRNAGGIATEDAIRSLIISHELLGTQEFLVINHTDCGMLTFKDEQLQRRLKEKYGAPADNIRFHSFSDLKENVEQQVKKIKSTKFFTKEIPVHGFIYDVKTGKLSKVI